MSDFQEWLASDTTKELSPGVSFIDADTIKTNDGLPDVRIQGVDAPEVARLYTDDEGNIQVKDGTLGGYASTGQIATLAKSLGFTQVKRTGVFGPHGREEGDLINPETGESFRTRLVQQGILPVYPEFDRGGLQQSADYGALLRTQQGREETEWDKARAMIDEAIAETGKKQGWFRQAQGVAGDWQHAVDYFVSQGMDEATAEKKASAIYNPDVAGISYGDRHIATGESLNPLSDAWDTGLIGVQEAMWGTVDMLSTGLGDAEAVEGYKEWLATVGQTGVQRARNRIADRGRIILDYKDVNGFGDAMEYISNNAVISLPYMALSMAGFVAAPLALAPAAVYAGQTWNEMEGDKSASIAVASGVLQASFDRLGIGAIFKAGRPPKQLLNDGINALMAKGMTKEKATETVMAATKKELAGFAGDAAKVAAQQLQAKQLFKAAAGRLAVSAGAEGVTEVAQETTAYLGATLGSDKQFDWTELNDRLINAAVAGSTLGGAFSVPGSAIDAGAWADVAYRTAPAEAKRLSDAGRWAEEEVANHGRVKSVRELNEETDARVAARGSAIVPLEDRVAADRQRRRDRTFEDRITETALATPGLWRGTIRHIIPQYVKDHSRAARKLADIFGGQLQRTFSGAGYENEKFHRVAQYKNMVDLPDRVYAALNGGQIPSAKQKREISDQVYDALQNSVNKEGNFDPSLVPEGPHKQQIIALQQQLQRLSDKMYDDQKKHNPDLGRLKNYLARYKAFDKQAIARNKDAFVEALLNKKEYGGTRAEAIELADQIINNAEINDFGEAFSAVKGEFKPPAHQERTLNLAEDPEFAQFMERDLFANVSNAVRSAARYTTHQDFVGRNGEKVAALLDEMQNVDGVDADTVNKIAAGMQDFLDAESGNYKRATSKAGKQLEKIQKNFMFVTMLAGLPLATISSFVELALTMRGLTKDQIFGKGGLQTVGKELADTLNLGMNEVTSYRPGARYKEKPVTYGKHQLRRLGFYEWDVGAATVTGATEISPLRQKTTENFFKITGLSGWTNYTRAVRASIGADYILDKLQVIMDTDPAAPTNESQEAREALRNIGINVDDMLMIEQAQMNGTTTPEMEAMFEDNMKEGLFNFINDAVALPQSANRPLIYQDPRFALFTQFQGFVATFTANHIPKLWGEYVKRGTPAMKYNAFAMMSMMIALGFASQYLKDLIKYGPGGNPYLEDPEYIQRGIRASGLLGSGERVLDQFAPIYETRSRNPVDWIYNQTTGEAPALGNVARLAKGVGKTIEGDPEAGLYQTLKSAPGVGPLTAFNKGLASLVTTGDWDYKGE